MTYRDFPFQAVRADEDRPPVLQGQTAIITAAGSGIGRAVAMLFAQEGANVVVADHDGNGAEETVAAIEAANGRACFFPGDAADPQYHVGLAAFAKHRYGWLDMAVNGVAVRAPSTPLAAISLATWDAMTANNISGTFYAMRAQIPVMLESGGGVIVNVASVPATGVAVGSGIRRATIEGLVALTKAIATEYGAQGIRANAIVPSRADAPRGNAGVSKARKQDGRGAPIDRLDAVREVAETALFLASSKSTFINGTCVPLNDGMGAR
ncbi:SDR family oxidoreductase [Sphingopyxis sp. Geo48]|uniref:SDR family NAD(P)-dependent oxidoreductase n=1 Tax=Sphingopyxis sp. Geo48 TaxID=545241 RepID=UPI0024B7FC66|nr:SDR family oxidoreductase [Sphingopyxis sp. Geo48]